MGNGKQVNREDALCTQTDPDMFFPVSNNRPPKDAYAVCARCPVVNECLDEALATSRLIDHGVWGGTLPAERARIRKRPSLRAVYIQRLKEEYSEEARERQNKRRNEKIQSRKFYRKDLTS